MFRNAVYTSFDDTGFELVTSNRCGRRSGRFNRAESTASISFAVSPLPNALAAVMIVSRSLLAISSRRTVTVTCDPLSSQLFGLQLRKGAFFNSRDRRTALLLKVSGMSFNGFVLGVPASNNSHNLIVLNGG